MSYGKEVKPLLLKNINILPGQFKEPARVQSGYCSIKPEVINVKLEPGQRITESIGNHKYFPGKGFI